MYPVARESEYCALATTARISAGVNLETIRAALTPEERKLFEAAEPQLDEVAEVLVRRLHGDYERGDSPQMANVYEHFRENLNNIILTGKNKAA